MAGVLRCGVAGVSDATRGLRRANRDRFESYLPLLERVRASYRRLSQRPEWHLIDGEHENIRAALTFALRAPAPEQALRLLTAIADYLCFYSAEAIGWFDDALSLPHHDVPPKVRADALAAYAYLEQHSNWAMVATVARESLRLYEQLNEAAGLARGHTVLSYVLNKQERPEAYTHALRALRFAGQADDPVLVAQALMRAGLAAPTLDESARYINDKNALHRAWGNWRAVIGGQGCLAYMAIAAGDYDEAERQLEAARQLNAGRDRIAEAGLAGNAGLIALFKGNVEAGAHAFLQELAIVRDLPMPEHHSEALQGLAAVSATAEEDSLAAMLLGAARSVDDAERPAAIDARLDEFFDAARNRAGGRAWQAALASGRRMSVAQAADLAHDSIRAMFGHGAETVSH